MTLVPLRSRKIISVAYGANATATPIPPTAIPAPTSAPVVSEPAEPPRTLISSEIQGGDTDFNVDALVWQSYWLSRNQFGPFVMASGMGSPALVNDPRDFDPMNFEAFRLNPDSFDTTISVRGQTETMLKESQWARNFSSVHFGVFDSKLVYTTDDVAWIIGGLNFSPQQATGDARSDIYRVFLGFYESTISLAGLQLSAPPGKSGAMSSPLEQNLPNMNYYHSANTLPHPMAGALTVAGSEITWDGSEWQLNSDLFVPASAMHLANEFNWVGPHLGSIPFPANVE